MFVECRTEQAIKTDADGYLLPIHQLDELVQLLRIVTHFDTQVRMDVYDWKLRMLQVGDRHLETRNGHEITEFQISDCGLRLR